MIGIQGSQGSGKTTLAQEYSKQTGIPFVKTSTSEVFKRLNLDPAKNFDFDTRMQVQEAVLDALTEQYEEARAGSKLGMFIADRTPIDCLAYTYSDMGQGALTEEQQERLLDYRQSCFDVLNEFFSVVITVQPGIPVAPERQGKASSSIAFIDHIDLLVKGLGLCEEVECFVFMIPEEVTDLDERVDAINKAYKQAVNRAKRDFQLDSEDGVPTTLH